jgi:hypothetical protein
MNHAVGTTHLSLAYAAALTAPWVVEDSFANELENWDGAFECIPYAAMPKNANYIRSLAFCRIKFANEGQHVSHLPLKTRIVLHGNEKIKRVRYARIRKLLLLLQSVSSLPSQPRLLQSVSSLSSQPRLLQSVSSLPSSNFIAHRLISKVHIFSQVHASGTYLFDRPMSGGRTRCCLETS